MASSMRLLLLLSATLGQVLCDVFVIDKQSGSKLVVFRDAASSFGASLPEDGLTGHVVQASPLTACLPISPAPVTRDRLPAIALIARYGGCNFEEKVQAAQKANFSAVIVFDINSDKLVPMGGEDLSLIPSVFIGYTDAEVILRMYLYPGNERVLFLLTGSDPFDINAYLLPFAIVVGICFFIMLGIVMFKCIQDHRRSRRHRLPKSALKKLPVIKFKPGDPYETCCICLDDFVEGDKLRILPCDHGYHSKCIDPWLVKNKRICPQCRKRVFDRRDDSDSEVDEETAPLLRNQRGRAVGGGTFDSESLPSTASPEDDERPSFSGTVRQHPVVGSPRFGRAGAGGEGSPLIQHAAIIHASVESIPDVHISSETVSAQDDEV